MAITIESIIDDALETVEWSYQHRELHAHRVDFSDAIREAIDSAMVYTPDILDYWVRNNMPEVDDLGAYDSILSAISEAVYYDLWDNISDYDILEKFIEAHAGTLEALGVDSDDLEEKYAALVEYMDEAQ